MRHQTLFLIAGKITALIATFAIPLVLTRLLSKEEYGIFAQFYVVVFFCTGIFNVSMQSSMYYFYPTADDHTRKSIVLQTIIFLFLVAVLAVALLSIPPVGQLIIGEGALLDYKFFILAGVILFMPVYILEPLYVVKKDTITSLVYPPAEVVLRISMIIMMYLVNPELSSVFYGILLSATFCALFVLIYSFREIGLKNVRFDMVNYGLLRQQLKYNIPFGMATSILILFERFDKIICISFLTPAQFAIYAIAFFGIPGILQVFDSLSQVYLIRMTVSHQENRTHELVDIYKSLVSKTFSFSFPIMLIVMLYAKKIILLLFTANYLDAVPLFRVYLISVMIFMLSSGLILRATGKTNITLRTYVQSAVFVLPLTYLLARYVGIWGAMAGALISIGLPKIWNLFREMKLVESSFAKFWPWREFRLIAMISVMAFVPYALAEVFLEYNIITTIILAVSYIAFVALLEMRYGIFPFDVTSILQRLPLGNLFLGKLNVKNSGYTT